MDPPGRPSSLSSRSSRTDSSRTMRFDTPVSPGWPSQGYARNTARFSGSCSERIVTPPRRDHPREGRPAEGRGWGRILHHGGTWRYTEVHVLHASRDGPPGGMARSVGSSTPGSPHPAHQAGSVLSPGTRTSFPRAMSTAPEPRSDIPRVLAPAPTGHPQGIHAYGSPAVQNPDTTPSD